MTLRIFSNDQPCRRCSECVGNDHHWLFCSFPPCETDDPEFRQDVQDWWEGEGKFEMECPAFWSCKHCSAWTPDDPDEVNDSELPDGSKYTRGPWRVDTTVALGAMGIWADYEPSKQICTVYGSASTVPREQRDANARLITAAPELLDACKAVLRFMQGEPFGNREIEQQIRAAIAKAE